MDPSASARWLWLTTALIVISALLLANTAIVVSGLLTDVGPSTIKTNAAFVSCIVLLSGVAYFMVRSGSFSWLPWLMTSACVSLLQVAVILSTDSVSYALSSGVIFFLLFGVAGGASLRRGVKDKRRNTSV